MARPKRLLIEERPLMVSPTLAEALGINEAILLQQLHFLLTITEESKNRHNFVNGRWWVYNSYKEWKTEQFPWLHEGTIKRLFLTLEEWGLVDSMQSVKNPSDRKKWYSIDYDALDGLEMTIGTNCDDGSTEQIVTMVGTNCDDGYSENTSETKENNLRANDARAEPPQAMLFDDNEPLPPEKVVPLKKSRKPDPVLDVIVSAFNVPLGQAVVIKQQAMGRIPENKPNHLCNFSPPATVEELTEFPIWYRGKHPDMDLPLSPPKFQRHFYEMRQSKAAAEQAKKPKTRVSDGRLLEFDRDMGQWFDVGSAPAQESPPFVPPNNERVAHGSARI